MTSNVRVHSKTKGTYQKIFYQFMYQFLSQKDGCILCAGEFRTRVFTVCLLPKYVLSWMNSASVFCLLSFVFSLRNWWMGRCSTSLTRFADWALTSLLCRAWCSSPSSCCRWVWVPWCTFAGVPWSSSGLPPCWALAAPSLQLKFFTWICKMLTPILSPPLDFDRFRATRCIHDLVSKNSHSAATFTGDVGTTFVQKLIQMTWGQSCPGNLCCSSETSFANETKFPLLSLSFRVSSVTPGDGSLAKRLVWNVTEKRVECLLWTVYLAAAEAIGLVVQSDVMLVDKNVFMANYMSSFLVIFSVEY